MLISGNYFNHVCLSDESGDGDKGRDWLLMEHTNLKGFDSQSDAAFANGSSINCVDMQEVL